MIGEALAAACADRAVLARIGGPLGEAARAALDRLERTERTERAERPEQAKRADQANRSSARRALRAEWAAAARAPVPPGLRGVHPSWIEAALAVLPARARADLARGAVEAGGGGSGAADPYDVSDDRIACWLVRWACAGLPPMPEANVEGPPASLDQAVRLRADELAAWLAEVGADQLALAVGAAGVHALSAAAQVVGARLTRAAARIGVSPRAGALGPVRAAITRCRVSLDDRALLVIGARALAPHAAALARRQLAVRLPRPLGLAVADALESFARAPLDQAPAWRALGAAY